MSVKKVNRKMSAILSADVKGYSRLMSADEEGTLKALNACRKIIDRWVDDHRGRVVDSPGDNVLAEFTSTVEAVKCAVKIQEGLNFRNADLPESSRMEFRIGVNLGDVIEEDDRIYGDGVNIAARLEGLADAGGVCISGTAFDQVKGKLSFGYQFIGNQTVKNIPDPIRAYKVLMAPEDAGKIIEKVRPKKWRWLQVAAISLGLIGVIFFISNIYIRQPPIEPASVDKMAFPLPDKPSIAVLPFDNLSGDPTEDYLGEGLSEQIITTLAKYPRLFVIARQSSFSFKGKPMKIQQVAEKLGVQYVLEGSVQKSGNKVRIIAQLIDAITGHHIWTERYDRELKDLFDLQDDIAIEVMNGISTELTEGEQARRWTQTGITNLKSVEKFYQAQGYFCLHTKENYEKARPLFEEAITLDPKFVWPYVYLGYLHNGIAKRGWSKSPAESLQTAFELAQKAIAIDDTHDGPHSLLATIYRSKDKYDMALSHAEKAIALNPNSSDAYMMLSFISGEMGRWEESVLYGEKSLRLSPFPGAAPFWALGRAYFMMGQYDKSIATWQKALKVSPKFLPGYVYLAASFSAIGQDEDAAVAVKKVLQLNPKFSIKSWTKKLLYKDKSDIELEVAALREAGFPEHASLPLPDKPSIAVLAFENMSGDLTQEYLSDGISEEIITTLSKIRHLFVIARTSSFKYKGKDVDIRTVGRELGVRYVLEGSVRIAEDKVRITAQLIDAKTNNHIWAERYDRYLEDIFALQDEITMKIINALQVELTEGEHARLWGKGTDNLEVYLKTLQAREFYLASTVESNVQARRLAEEAIALDPDYAPAYHVLSVTHFDDVIFQTSRSPDQSIKFAIELAQKGIALDDSYALAHGFLGVLYTYFMRDYEKGILEAQKGVALDPNGAHGYLYLSLTLRYSGKFEEAIQANEKAIRLNPFPPVTYYRFACMSYIGARRYEEAIAAGKKAITVEPDDHMSHMQLAAAYSLAGRQDEANIEAKEVLRLNPKFSVDFWSKTLPYRNQADREHLIGALLKAGLPE